MKSEWYFRQLDQAHERQIERRLEAQEQLRKWRGQWEPLERMTDDTRKDDWSWT